MPRRVPAVHNCTRDEGGPFGFGNQVLISSHRKLLRKCRGGERCGNTGTMILAGAVERGERKQTVDEVSKAFRRCQNWGVTLPLGSAREMPETARTAPACRRREARPGFRMERENLFSDVKGQATAAPNREGESTEAERRERSSP